MSDNAKIVDAVSFSNTKPQDQKVPLRLDTTQMEKVIKEMAAKAMTATTIPGIQTNQQQQAAAERINPSIFIRDMSAEMERLYQRFETLKILAAEINGRNVDEPLPPQVIFKGFTLEFAISKDDKVTDHSVKMQALSCIGDISNLMSNEFGFIIASLRELSRQVADLAQKTNDRCTEAFKEWEASNKNKQIVSASGGVVSSSSVDVAGATGPMAPITLQAQ